MLNVIMLSIVKLSVVMVSVVFYLLYAGYHYAECRGPENIVQRLYHSGRTLASSSHGPGFESRTPERENMSEEVLEFHLLKS